VIGAPEMVIADADHDARARADELASSGRRVLLLAQSQAPLDGEELPSDLEPVALLVFEENIRPDAADTLEYFSEQGVTLRVISGDNPVTVGAVAARVGMEGADDPVDARTLPEDVDALADVVESRSVYGRVTPHQKRSMVAALQSRDHVVAMTGDGVNDALALKDADIGIAMGSGAPATRAVAQLVLLDGRFASMPGVVAEGRRVIANVERVANLFITKTVYAVLLAVTVGVFRWPYPFLPRHLTIVSSLTIGIPAFFLALAPNPQRYVPGFIARVGRFAIPAGTVAAIATGASFVYARDVADVPLDVERTVATITLLIVGLYVLSILARPLTPARVLLVGSMVALFLLAVLVPFAQDFFALEPPTGETLVVNLLIAAAACGILEIGWTIVQHRLPQEDRTPRVLLRGWQGAQRSPMDVLRDVLGLTPTDTERDRVGASDDR
jgi:cation-transporting ATPase E